MVFTSGGPDIKRGRLARVALFRHHAMRSAGVVRLRKSAHDTRTGGTGPGPGASGSGTCGAGHALASRASASSGGSAGLPLQEFAATLVSVVAYLIPEIVVTGELAAGRWTCGDGVFRWAQWRDRSGHSHAVDGFPPGRLIYELPGEIDRESLGHVVDTFTGLLDLAQNPLGVHLSAFELPAELAAAAVLHEPSLQPALALQARVLTGWPDFRHHNFGDGPVVWALEHLDLARRDARLREALGHLFTSHLEYNAVGDDVAEVLSLQPPDDRPTSLIDQRRLRRAFHDCYSAIEALLGGAPRGDVRGALIRSGIDPDAVGGFRGRDVETTLDRVLRMRTTRNRQAAHGGGTAAEEPSLTFFEVMDAQHATAGLLREYLADSGGLPRVE